MIAEKILKEIKDRLRFLDEVGVGYLSLARPAQTLSGGEAQRIRLATQIGSSLVGVIYVLDEPSIGLHQRDNDKLLETLIKLRDLGNTVLVPATSLLNETNAESGYGSLGLAAENCRAQWGRPPNFLNVDFYDQGSYPGSVFEVAAAMNGVQYTGTCCGTTESGAAKAST